MKASSPATQLDHHRATTFTAELVTTRVETVNWSLMRGWMVVCHQTTRITKEDDEMPSHGGVLPVLRSYVRQRGLILALQGHTTATGNTSQ